MNRTTKIVAGGTFALLMFAVATSANAFSAELADRLGLSDTQLAALEEAHELRKSGDHDAAKLVIEDAGIDLSELREVKSELREERKELRESIKAAVDDGDYDEFVELAEGTKIGDVIENESDFEKLVEAHELREQGDREGSKEIIEELCFERPEHKNGQGPL